MKTLPIPSVSPVDIYKSIYNAKRVARRNRLKSLVPVIESCYENYEQLGPNLGNLVISQWNGVEKSDLLHCYSHATAPLNFIKAQILTLHASQQANHAVYCPYCCLIARRSTFDHYVPKEEFPEFAAYIGNLVPCCKDCNTLKGMCWRDLNKDRLFLHFYLDMVPSSQFLFADTYIGSSLQVHFRLSDNSSDFGGNERIIRSHFKRLRLLERYQEAAPDEFTSYGGVVASQDIETTQAMLLDQAAKLTNAFSANHWKVALYQAMARDRIFLQNLS